MGLPARSQPSSADRPSAASRLARPALFADYLPASPVEPAPATNKGLPFLLLKATARAAFIGTTIAAPVAVWVGALR